jgi:hypothetical protein
MKKPRFIVAVKVNDNVKFQLFHFRQRQVFDEFVSECEKAGFKFFARVEPDEITPKLPRGLK